uniref:Uncharacterized protein n=1 Tax=Arundo donax TaxID=35708 RepID=A0A0A9FG26_ARUDO
MIISRRRLFGGIIGIFFFILIIGASRGNIRSNGFPIPPPSHISPVLPSKGSGSCFCSGTLLTNYLGLSSNCFLDGFLNLFISSLLLFTES